MWFEIMVGALGLIWAYVVPNLIGGGILWGLWQLIAVSAFAAPALGYWVCVLICFLLRCMIKSLLLR